MNIEEVLEDIKRHLDYVNATNQSSIRDNQIKVMYEEIERLKNIIKEVREIIYDNRYGHGELCLENQQVLELLKLLGSDKE